MKLHDRQTNEQFIKQTYFKQAHLRLTRLAGRFVNETFTVVEEAAAIFDAMLPTMTYVDQPEHPLAPALFTCNANIALYLALKKRGVEVHAFGNAMLNGLARAPIPRPQESAEMKQQHLAQFAASAKVSQEKAQAGEDIFEVVEAKNGEFEWRFNIKSCSICHSAAQQNASELVPYLCAVDDVMSDKGNWGLRRSGSLALGAQHCDFRYQTGQPLRLAEQYPQQIRVIFTGAPLPFKS